MYIYIYGMTARTLSLIIIQEYRQLLKIKERNISED